METQIPAHTRHDRQDLRDHIAAKVLEEIKAEFDQHKIYEFDINPHAPCDHNPNLLEFKESVDFTGYHLDVYQCADCGELVTDIKPYTNQQEMVRQ